uniref:Uncharacterized protein n=1 Tax=Anguilla anguilla TaxID=7936 RepID=A0A0E9VRZ0_ANGAN
MLHHTSKTKKKKRQNVSLSVTRLVDVVLCRQTTL